MLVNCCECCLLAHPSFAPFVYQLIGEKLIDDETTVGTKMEICTFLVTHLIFIEIFYEQLMYQFSHISDNLALLHFICAITFFRIVFHDIQSARN